MLAKSPRENEKRIIKVKQHTIAGPKSPNIKNRRTVAMIANSEKKKKEKRLCHDVYSEIYFSLAAKNPARKNNH